MKVTGLPIQPGWLVWPSSRIMGCVSHSQHQPPPPPTPGKGTLTSTREGVRPPPACAPWDHLGQTLFWRVLEPCSWLHPTEKGLVYSPSPAVIQPSCGPLYSPVSMHSTPPRVSPRTHSPASTSPFLSPPFLLLVKHQLRDKWASMLMLKGINSLVGLGGLPHLQGPRKDRPTFTLFTKENLGRGQSL